LSGNGGAGHSEQSDPAKGGARMRARKEYRSHSQEILHCVQDDNSRGGEKHATSLNNKLCFIK